MIKFYVAPPGSGKTLIIVQRDIPQALKAGKKVYHNIPGLNAVKMAYYCGLYANDVDGQLEYMYTPYIEKYIEDNNLSKEADKLGLDKFEEQYSERLSRLYRTAVPEILEYIPTLGKNYLIVIDEVQNFVGATDYKEPKNVKFFEYASVHRHLGHELVLATQHEDNVDVKLRRIANLLVYMYRRDILGKLFANTVTEKHYAGCATGNPELLNKYVTKYDKRVFGLYKSYVAGDIVESRKYRSIWRNTKLILLGIALIFCLSRVPSFFKSWNLFGFGKKKEAVVSKPAANEKPEHFFGSFKEYYCDRKVYVLRVDGNVDSLPARGVPTSICPYVGYVGYSKNGGSE
jgi:zona occludens toxin (predicted ATPase)